MIDVLKPSMKPFICADFMAPLFKNIRYSIDYNEKISSTISLLEWNIALIHVLLDKVFLFVQHDYGPNVTNGFIGYLKIIYSYRTSLNVNE